LSDSRKEIARPPASLGSAGSNDDPDAAKRLGHRLLDQSETLLSPSPRRQCPAVSGHRSGYQGGLLDPFIASMNRLDAWKSSLFFDIDFKPPNLHDFHAVARTSSIRLGTVTSSLILHTKSA
jgi:hypothetical protein